jgi:hypothetical protein
MKVGHISTQIRVYIGEMDPMINIPKDRKPIRPLRLVLLMGMTLLLFLLILNRYGTLSQAIVPAG